MKRPAAKEQDRSRKKPHVATKGRSAPKTGRKTKFVDKEVKAPKRKTPITAVAKDDSATEDSDEDFGEPDEEEENDSFGEEDVAEPEEQMDVDDQPKSINVPVSKAAGENHAAQRQAAKERRLAKPNGQLMLEAKAAWELARQNNLSKAERTKNIDALMKVVRGKVKDLVTKHDASRVIQTLVKYGSQPIRDEIATELRGTYLNLIQTRYSKHLVLKLIRHCQPINRSFILAEFHTHVIKLLLHREASQVLSDAFEMYASPAQKNLLIRDFYGKEVQLFDTERCEKGGLAGVLDGADESRRTRVIGALKETLLRIFDNPDKGAVGHPVVHRALWEYLQQVSRLETEEAQAKAHTEMFENCHELLADMAHTKDGSRAVREFVAWGSAKDRKKILKTFKPHLEKMCLDDQAQLVLFTCLDAIDDTKTLVNSLVNEVVSIASKLCFAPSSTSAASTTLNPVASNNATGRRSILYLLAPRDQRYFPPALCRTIAETDPIIAKTSKKDSGLRRKEVASGASEGLLKFVADNAERLVRDPAGSLVAVEIMLHADGDQTAAISGLLFPLSEVPYPAPSAAPHPIDLAHSSRLYKTLLQGGHFSRESKVVISSPTFSAIAFAREMLSAVGIEKLIDMASTHGGPGAFVLIELIERITRNGMDDEKAVIRNGIGQSQLAQRLSNAGADVKGKEALLAKISDFQTV